MVSGSTSRTTCWLRRFQRVLVAPVTLPDNYTPGESGAVFTAQASERHHGSRTAWTTRSLPTSHPCTQRRRRKLMGYRPRPHIDRARHQIERAARLPACPWCRHPVQVHDAQGGHRVCLRGHEKPSCRVCREIHDSLLPVLRAYWDFARVMASPPCMPTAPLAFGRPVHSAVAPLADELGVRPCQVPGAGFRRVRARHHRRQAPARRLDRGPPSGSKVWADDGYQGSVLTSWRCWTPPSKAPRWGSSCRGPCEACGGFRIDGSVGVPGAPYETLPGSMRCSDCGHSNLLRDLGPE